MENQQIDKFKKKKKNNTFSEGIYLIILGGFALFKAAVDDHEL